MSFQVALTGLDAATSNLEVISNNIANSNTSGFKRSRAEFADVYAASAGGSSNTPGKGVRVTNIRQQFTQGDINYTENSLDLAISGGGMFRLKDNGGGVVFSRAGMFGLDRDGYISNATSQRLTGYQVDDQGNVLPTLGEIQVDRSDLEPKASKNIEIGMNLDQTSSVIGTPFDAQNPKSYNFSTGTSVIDSQGSTHVINYYYRKDSDNNWSMYVEADDTKKLVGNPNGYKFSFGNNGRISTITERSDEMLAADQLAASTAQDLKTATVNKATADVDKLNADTALAADPENPTLIAAADAATNAANEAEAALTAATIAATDAATNAASLTSAAPRLVQQTADGIPEGKFNVTLEPSDLGSSVDAITVALDLTATTQFDAPSGVNISQADGFSSGRLVTLEIDNTGTVFGRYTNGQSKALGQVALAAFANTEGMRPVGDTSWAETYKSGAAAIGAPGTASLGYIQSSALESSNVDITEELVDMIGAQRNFQANAQVISVTDTLTQTIINMRR